VSRHSWTVSAATDPGTWELRSHAGNVAVVRGGPARAVTNVEYRALRVLLEGPPDVLTFHAALVARDGRGLLILGPNEAGKSTLACALWRRGFSLLGDDVTLVDPERGEARSAPRRVSLRTPSRRLLGEHLWARIVAAPSSEATNDGRVFHPDEVDGRPRASTTRIAACMILARRGAQTAPASAARLEPAQGALALLPYTNLIRRLDTGDVIRRVAPLASVVPTYDLARGPLPEMVATVERMLDGQI
jgi:hypothetical protein